MPQLADIESRFHLGRHTQCVRHAQRRIHSILMKSVKPIRAAKMSAIHAADLAPSRCARNASSVYSGWWYTNRCSTLSFAMCPFAFNVTQ